MRRGATYLRAHHPSSGGSGAGQHAKAAHRPSSHGPPPPQQQNQQSSARSHSVLATLVRLRGQFQRLRYHQQQQAIAVTSAHQRSSSSPAGPSAASSSSAAAAATGDGGEEAAVGGEVFASQLRTAILVCREAQRLLNNESRRSDALSDVSPSTALYAVEVGKLIGTAAAFGAATTFPRVDAALSWVCENESAMTSPRRVMSICMPILNLSDGPTAGVAFILRVLYMPLLLALQDVAAVTAPPPPDAPSTTDTSTAVDASTNESTVQQQLVAITSAMAMVSKWATMRLGSTAVAEAAQDTAAEELEKMTRIAEASVVALRRQVKGGLGSSAGESAAAMAHLTPTDALHWIQCLRGLEKMHAHATAGSRDGAAAAERRTLLCYRVLLPLMQHVLGGGAGADAADTAVPTSGARGSASLRVPEVVELLQVGLSDSVEPMHRELVIAYGLRALPRSLVSATVKELNAAVQMVNRVRQQRPAAVPASLLLSTQAALRPVLFVLRETQPQHLRASDCGMLLSGLSRWEEVPGVVVSTDIVELLSQRFCEQISAVAASQLVPFVTALARLEDRQTHQQRDDARGTAGDGAASPDERASPTGQTRDAAAVPVTTAGAPEALELAAAAAAPLPGGAASPRPRHRFRTTARTVEQCGQRAVTLAAGGAAAEEVQLSPADAAQLLASLVQLDAPQCAEFFDKAEPLLARGMHGTATTAAVSPPASAAIHLRVITEEALQRFARHAVAGREGLASSRHTCASDDPAPRSDGDDSAVADAAQRATALLRGGSRSLAGLVRGAAHPKDLVQAGTLLRRRLMSKRSSGGGTVSPQKAHHTRTPAVAARACTRGELRLAALFAAQAVRVSPECGGPQLAALAGVASSLHRAGALPRPAAQGVLRALWARYTAGSRVDVVDGVDSAVTPAACALTLENCKVLMDASSTAHLVRTAPPVAFLEMFAAQCARQPRDGDGGSGGAGSHATSGAAARAYDEALAKLRRTSALGRTLVSYLTSLRPPARSAAAVERGLVETAPWQEAQMVALEAYLSMARAAIAQCATEAALMEVWSTDAHGSGGDHSPVLPLRLLGTTANVVAQVYRLAHHRDDPHRLGGGAADAAESGAGATDAATVVDEADETSPLLLPSSAPPSLSTTGVERTAREALGLLGDFVVALARQQQQQLLSRASLDPASDVDLAGGSRPFTDAPSQPASAQAPKHLLMLLQAFETVRCSHPEMLYSVLPELRRCADQLDPLELSLLVRALTQLGAWNSQLLNVLATAVESKMERCELRQCYTLLRGLCRSGCVSPDTYVELRAAPRSDWTRGGGTTSHRASAAQQPLQLLVESALRRLDALVRVEGDFASLARTAALSDVVGVVNTLRFFHAPPPAAYDAFVVLAIRRLASLAPRLSLRTVTQHAVALLDAVPELRQPEQQRVSAQVLWTVLQRALTSGSTTSGEPDAAPAVSRRVEEALPLRICWALCRLAAAHSLRYGSATTHDFFAPLDPPSADGQAISCAALTRDLLHRLLVSHTANAVAGARTPVRPVLAAAELAGLRRYALHVSPSLVRGDRELDAFVCAPLSLARAITSGDPTALIHAAATAAPAAQSRRCVRLVACLLRSDVWRPSCHGAADDAAPQLLTAALQRLWAAAELRTLLRNAPSAFSTEELLVLAAAAARVHRCGTDVEAFAEDFAISMRELGAATAEWRLPAAVDAWMLFAMPMMAHPPTPASVPHLDNRNGGGDDFFAMLAASGDVLATSLARAQRSWAASGERVLPELLRLYHGAEELDVALRRGESEDVTCPPRASSVDAAFAAASPEASASFASVYKEVLDGFAACLTGAADSTPA
ncbi:hypothetical protein NESM_000036600 [Novymonas esmeraldas]|uniref:Uncharacterized protein n=1 Tax=Novymonas esmeraldas TaxID=1808958 RepID=A0AAW0F3Z0_9TRYP